MQCSTLVGGCENTNQNVGISSLHHLTLYMLTRLATGQSALNMEADAFEISANQPIQMVL
jgi:hypothetical protein